MWIDILLTYAVVAYVFCIVIFKTISMALGPELAVVFVLLSPISLPLAAFILWINS
jgi:hypothetical protein